MTLLSLSLHRFRCYREAYFEFSPKVNLIYGENGQGKTSLLEGISVLLSGRSFRTPFLADLVQAGASFFHLEARFVRHGIEQTLQVTSDGSTKKIYHNSTRLSSSCALFGLMTGAILSPEDHELIKGPPSIRRQFLDLQIGQTDPLHLYHLSRYIKAMKQRNALLRQRDFQSIQVWEEEMARCAGWITMKRLRASYGLEEARDSLQKQLTDLNAFAIHYKSAALAADKKTVEEIQAYYLEQYASNRMKESESKGTWMGPHRDDLAILMDQKQARYRASEGQQRCCIAALRLAEWNRIKDLTGELPLMGIDDMRVSLDEKRQDSLFRLLKGMGQVFLTSPTTRLEPGLADGSFPILIQKTSGIMPFQG